MEGQLLKAESQITEAELEVMKILWEYGRPPVLRLLKDLPKLPNGSQKQFKL